MKPSKEALEVAHEWLVSHGIKASDCSYSPARDWIFVTLPVGKVETLLKTEYSTYIDDEGMMIYRTTEYSLPKALHAHVSTIQPTTSFSRMKRANRQARRNPNLDSFAELQQRGSDSSVPSICNASNVTLACLREVYGTANVDCPHSQ